MRTVAARPSAIASAARWNSSERISGSTGVINRSAGSPASRLRPMRTCITSMLDMKTLSAEGMLSPPSSAFGGSQRDHQRGSSPAVRAARARARSRK